MNGLVSGYGSDSDDDEVTSDTKKSKDEGKAVLKSPSILLKLICIFFCYRLDGMHGQYDRLSILLESKNQ